MPQVSILGPVLFNIFINDIFHVVSHSQLHVYNYADDNTVSCADHNLRNIVENLVRDSLSLLQWFSDNQMKANPEKIQAIAVGKRTKTENIAFRLENNVISCDANVKLLGVKIDFQLNFDTRISYTCKKAPKQLNVLKRIGKYLCKLGN